MDEQNKQSEDESLPSQQLQEQSQETPAQTAAPLVSEKKQTQELPPQLVSQPKVIGAPLPRKLDKFKEFIVECKRVLRVTKKPDKEEFLTIVKISAAGMAIIGFLGFLIHLGKELLF